MVNCGKIGQKTQYLGAKKIIFKILKFFEKILKNCLTLNC